MLKRSPARICITLVVKEYAWEDYFKERPAYGNSWQGRSTGIRDQESSWEYVCRQKSTHTFLGGKRSFYEKNTYILLGQFISIDDIVSG